MDAHKRWSLEQIEALKDWTKIGVRDPKAKTLGDELSRLLGIDSIGRTDVISGQHHLTPRGEVNVKHIRRLIRAAMGNQCPVQEFYDGPDAVCQYGNHRCLQPHHLVGQYDKTPQGSNHSLEMKNLLEDALRNTVEVPPEEDDFGHDVQLFESNIPFQKNHAYFMGLPFDDEHFKDLMKEFAGARAHWAVEHGDCWLLLKGNVPKFKRELGLQMGLLPAWSHEKSPYYIPERAAEGLNDVWIRSSCGYQRCWKPAHLIATYGKLVRV